MFIQVIQGRVSDAGEMRTAFERWTDQLAPGASGWLGSTGGVTAEGTFVGLARFTSRKDALRNSGRPEQHQWWMETSKLFSGEVTFHDCDQVETWLRGGSDVAGFVQVMQGRILDADRMREINERFSPLLADFRPEIIGATIALHGDGGFTEAVYFTAEEAARKGERKEPTSELKQILDEEMALTTDLTYFDLHEPWLYSPR